jgi:hypothetical protein
MDRPAHFAAERGEVLRAASLVNAHGIVILQCVWQADNATRTDFRTLRDAGEFAEIMAA